MSIASAIVTYVIIWWLVFFMALPFGVERPNEDEVEVGHEPGAPKKPMLVKKALVTSVITAVLLAIWWYVQSSGLIKLDA
ncbi:DUF1467 family protein [Curvivirga sp.]|uniref:DUF1467 family protein n=1 Tax=Curvivirga sp. TaxID=2856848 RepID=UPI003B59B69F